MRADTALLLCAALSARSVSGAARPVLSRRGQQLYPASNRTLVTLSRPLSTLTSSSDRGHPSSLPNEAVLAVEPPDQEPPHSASSGTPMSSPAPSTSVLPDSAPKLYESSAQLPSATQDHLSTADHLPAPPTSLSPEATVTVTINCPPGSDGPECTEPATINGPGNYSEPVTTPKDECTSIPENRPITHFSVVYTSTVTFSGNRSDYTPPYEPLVTPNLCTPTFAPAFAPAHISGFEPLDHATAANAAPTALKDLHRHAPRPSFTFITTDKNPSVAFPSDPPPRITPTRGRVPKHVGNAHHKPAYDGDDSGDEEIGSGTHKTAAGGDNGGSRNLDSPEDDGHPPDDHGSGVHKPAAGAGDGLGVHVKPGPQGFPIPDAAHGRLPSFKITARGNQVTINDKTFSDLVPGATSMVTANGASFTIGPNAIVGAGATIQKPVPAGTVVSVATPTSDVLGGLPVTITGSEAVVGHATLTMAEEDTATVVDGQQVSLKPGTLVVATETLSFQPVMPAREKEMLVKGGELLTAVGRSIVVIHSTTYTYGSGVAETTQVVDGDTIAVGPSGVMVHGMLIGGPSADATETRFEAVGGATITRVAPSLAIINGATFTIGPGTRWTTTVVAGETLTVGPTGVVMSTVTLKYPFGLAVTSTVRPTETHGNDGPVETANGGGARYEGSDADDDDGDDDDDDDSMGSLARPDLRAACIALSIATGVLFWV